MSDAEKEALKETTDVINDTQETLSKIREKTATMSEQNKKAATKYVANIRDILKKRTQYSVQKLNDMISDKVREIEKEFDSFDTLVVKNQSGLVDIFNKNIKTEYDNIAQKIDSKSGTESLDQVIRIAEREISDMLDSIDQMYRNNVNDLAETVINEVASITYRISKLLKAERKYTNSTVQNRIDMCYNISSQNKLITDQLTSTMKVIKDIADTRKKVDTLEFSVEDLDEYSKQTFEDAKSRLTKTEQTDREFLDSLVQDESNFLGSMVTKDSFADNEDTKTFVLDSFKAVIDNFPKYLNETLSKYSAVKEENFRKVAVEVEAILKEVGDDLKAKAALITSTDTRNEYIEKANFEKLKSYTTNRLANMLQQINAIFRNMRDEWLDKLEYVMEYLSENQLPHVNDQSVKKYLPTDLCALATDFQKYVLSTMGQSGNDTSLDAFEDEAQKTWNVNLESPLKKSDGGDFITEQDRMDAGASFFAQEFVKEMKIVKITGSKDSTNETKTGDDNDTDVNNTEDLSKVLPSFVTSKDSVNESKTGNGSDMDANGTEGLSKVLPPFINNAVQKIINAFTNAGYEVEGTVEIYVLDDDNK